MSRLDIAVIAVCRDLGRFLEESLRGVEGQTRPPAEYILVDDGSTDPLSLQVLARVEKAGRWRLVRTPNRGVSAARNLGFGLSTAPLVAFLDGDDIFDECWLEKAGSLLEDNPNLDFVSSAMEAFGAADYFWRPPDPELVESICFGVPHMSSLMRRELIEAVGGFDEEIRSYEELDFWTRVLAEGFSGTVLGDISLKYRTRENSLYHEAIREHRKKMEAFFKRHQDLIRDHQKEILQRREAFLLSQRDHQRHVSFRKEELEAEIDAINHKIIEVENRLAARGEDSVDFGDLRRTRPISPWWGLDRGRPLDRFYIEAFLNRFAGDIRGRVLEIKDPGYTRLFGGDHVEDSLILDIDPTNPQATIYGDLSMPGVLEEGKLDCFILTQTLNIIYDFRSALVQSLRALRPGGVLLCTVSALNRISYEDGGLDGDYWRFTEASLRRLFAEFLPPENFEIIGYGNVLSCTALLYGLALHELSREELEEHDPFFPLVYGVRAVRPKESKPRETLPNVRSTRSKPIRETPLAAVLAWHRISEETGPDPWSLRVQPSLFSQQLEALRTRFQILRVSELVERHQNGDLEGDSIALSFDDGYLDMLESVSPVLLAHRLPATFFISSIGWDHPTEFWWDRLVRLIFEASGEELDFDGRSIDLRSEASRSSGLNAAWDRLSGLEESEREETLDRAFEHAGLRKEVSGCPRPMLAGELRELASRPGHDIGAHSANHRRLVQLPAEIRRQEIVDNREALEALLGRPVPLFAYPFGELDGPLATLVERMGFLGALTMDDRLFRALDDPFHLPRIDVHSFEGTELLKKILDS